MGAKAGRVFELARCYAVLGQRLSDSLSKIVKLDRAKFEQEKQLQAGTRTGPTINALVG